jgi:hypothetical protein
LQHLFLLNLQLLPHCSPNPYAQSANLAKGYGIGWRLVADDYVKSVPPPFFWPPPPPTVYSTVGWRLSYGKPDVGHHLFNIAASPAEQSAEKGAILPKEWQIFGQIAINRQFRHRRHRRHKMVFRFGLAGD